MLQRILNFLGIPSFKEYALEMLKGTLDESFVIALIIALILMILIIAGSKRARKWLYWTIIIYAVVEFGKAAIGV